MAATTPSSSQTSGEAGSVKPRLTSTTTRAGRRPKPARPWNLSWCIVIRRESYVVARPDACERVLRRLERRPPQRRRGRRRVEAGLLLAAGDHVVELGPEVERGRVASRRPLPLALGLRRRLVDGAVVGEDDAVALFRPFAADEPEGDVACDELGGTVEPVLPAAAARRPVDEHVAGLDDDVVALRRQRLLCAVG